MLRIYKEGGGKGVLGLEVERWEGVVREVGSDPVGLREMGEGEKKVKKNAIYSDFHSSIFNSFSPVQLTLIYADVNPRTTSLSTLLVLEKGPPN